MRITKNLSMLGFIISNINPSQAKMSQLIWEFKIVICADTLSKLYILLAKYTVASTYLSHKIDNLLLVIKALA